MNFSDALVAVLHGAKVARTEWDDSYAHVCLHRDQLCIIKTNDVYRPWLITVDDMEATDWEAVLMKPEIIEERR